MRHAAASASSATLVQCSRSQGDFRPVIAGKPDRRSWLALERDLPDPRLVELGEHLIEVLHSELGEPRLVRLARPALDDGACLLGAGSGQEQGRVPRDVQKTHRQRDLLARDVGVAPAVPAREHVPERRLDVRTQAEPQREPLRDLAHRRERLAGPRRGLGDRRLDHLRADLLGSPEPDVGSVELEHLRRVGRVDEVEGGSVRDVVAE
jgi:hypothetical protein